MGTMSAPTSPVSPTGSFEESAGKKNSKSPASPAKSTHEDESTTSSDELPAPTSSLLPAPIATDRYESWSGEHLATIYRELDNRHVQHQQDNPLAGNDKWLDITYARVGAVLNAENIVAKEGEQIEEANDHTMTISFP